MGSGHLETTRKGEPALEKGLLSGGRGGWGRLCPGDLTSLEVWLKQTPWGCLFLDTLQEREFSLPPKHLSVSIWAMPHAPLATP